LRQPIKSPRSAKTAGLGRFTSAQKEGNLQRLREAADRLFSDEGYMAVAVDDIAKAAGVTRKTFYRHFEGKYEAALDLFNRQRKHAIPLWSAIKDQRYEDLAVIRGWLEGMFRIYKGRHVLRAYVELATIEPRFAASAKNLVPEFAASLGEAIPAFALRGRSRESQRHQTEAFLLLHQIINQCVLAARGFSQMEEPIVLDILAQSFQAFVTRAS
jgi:AcrR family transcriptional regulator